MSYLDGILWGASALSWYFTIKYWLMIRRHKRDATQLIREARRGTDLMPHHPERSERVPHWSDICATCHHERRLHPITGGCGGRPGLYCMCKRFEPNR